MPVNQTDPNHRQDTAYQEDNEQHAVRHPLAVEQAVAQPVDQEGHRIKIQQIGAIWLLHPFCNILKYTRHIENKPQHDRNNIRQICYIYPSMEHNRTTAKGKDNHC